MSTKEQLQNKLIESIIVKDFVSADKLFEQSMKKFIFDVLKEREQKTLDTIGSALFIENEDPETDLSDINDALSNLGSDTETEEKVDEEDDEETETDADAEVEDSEENKDEADSDATANVEHKDGEVTIEITLQDDEELVDKILKAAGIDKDQVEETGEKEEHKDEEKSEEDNESEESEKEDDSEDDSDESEESEEENGDDEDNEDNGNEIDWFSNTEEPVKESIERKSLFKQVV